MNRILVPLLLVISVSLGSLACQGSDSKKARCKDIFARAAAAAQAAGKTGHIDHKPEARASFMVKCQELPDEAIACLDMAKAKDATCKGVRDQQKMAVPFGLE